MIFPLEQNGQEINFVPRVGECFDAEGMPIEPGSTVMTCAWHDVEKTLTSALTKAGYKVSHGICEFHRKEMESQI
jgi:hypothetical protein